MKRLFWATASSIMSRRPGRIREILPVDIPRPRKILSVRAHPQLHRTKKFHLGDAQAGSRPNETPGENIHEPARSSASSLVFVVVLALWEFFRPAREPDTLHLSN